MFSGDLRPNRLRASIHRLLRHTVFRSANGALTSRVLPVGTPGEWRPLYENIEGFTHKEGMRNVVAGEALRAQSGACWIASPTLYVLDLIVETELVNPNAQVAMRW